MTTTPTTESNYNQLWVQVYDGLDFMVEHFDDCEELSSGRKLFPRTISTGATRGAQHTVESSQDAMTFYRAALYEDCRMNAYANYEEMKKRHQIRDDYKPIPRHVLIDLDRASFTTNEELETALKETVSNIKRHILMGLGPIVIWSGNGYHIHIPLDLDAAFENMPDFAMFENPSNKFLRWAERRLSNGSADQCHNPSIKSCMFRVPGTLNSKCKAAGKDPLVRIVEPDYEIDICSRSTPRQDFLNDFHAHLIQEIIDDKIEKSERRQRLAIGLLFNKNSSRSMPWIDKLLQTGVEDNRKALLFWVLAPYLITVRSVGYDRAYSVLEAWLDKCNEVRRLEPDRTAFRYRIRYCLQAAENQKRKPVRFDTFKERYPDIYKKLLMS